MTERPTVQEVAPPNPVPGERTRGAHATPEARAAVARVLADPSGQRRARSRTIRRGALGLAMAGVAAIGGVVVWDALKQEPDVLVTLGGSDAPAPARADGAAGVEMEVVVEPAPGVELSGDALMDRATSILNARAETMTIPGLEIRRVGDRRLLVFVPGATSTRPAGHTLLSTLPFGIYSSDQVIASASSAVTLVARYRGRPLTGRGAIHGLFRRGGRVSYFGGPYTLAAAERDRGPEPSPVELIELPVDHVVVQERLAPDRRHRQGRNRWLLVRGRPAITSERLVSVETRPKARQVTSGTLVTRVGRLDERGAAELRALAEGAALRNSNILVVTSSHALRVPTSRLRPDDWLPLTRLQWTSGAFWERTWASLARGGGSLLFTTVTSRRVGGPDVSLGEPVAEVPRAIRRLVDDQRRGRAPQTAVRLDTLRRAMTIRRGAGSVELLTALDRDGAQRAFVRRGNGAGQLHSSTCSLTTDLPVVSLCVYGGLEPTVSVMTGRVGADVTRVELVVGATVREATVANGWWMLVARDIFGRRQLEGEIVARDASGTVIGRSPAVCCLAS